VTPELMLRKAARARTPATRAKYARRGLDASRLDRDTRAMLLRQLYLSLMERRDFSGARRVAEEMATLEVLPDVAHQDVARACLGEGDLDGATRHLRLALRLGPPSRRAFHFWTLGSILYLHGHPEEAVRALSSAARWGTTEKPLYRAQLALARIEAGLTSPSLLELRQRLEQAPCGQGYGRYVLGEICIHLSDKPAAEAYFTEFLRRTTGGRVALAVALGAEIRRARRHLAALRRQRRR